MRKIREILRLTQAEGLSRRQVSAAVGLPYTTLSDYLARARRAELTWPLPEGLDDADLEARLFSRPVRIPANPNTQSGVFERPRSEAAKRPT